MELTELQVVTVGIMGAVLYTMLIPDKLTTLKEGLQLAGFVVGVILIIIALYFVFVD
jgi:uncharacterized membrane protein